MKKFIIYVGLNDQETKNQEITTIDAFKVVTNICIKHVGGCTINESKGVYTHNDGTIVIENTLVCIIFSDDIDQVKKAACDIKTALNQESVIFETIETISTFI